MRLTNYTDFSLRVLIYLASKEQGELSNITEIANAYSISRNHLTKVIHELGKMGVIDDNSWPRRRNSTSTSSQKKSM